MMKTTFILVTAILVMSSTGVLATDNTAYNTPLIKKVEDFHKTVQGRLNDLGPDAEKRHGFIKRYVEDYVHMQNDCRGANIKSDPCKKSTDDAVASMIVLSQGLSTLPGASAVSSAKKSAAVNALEKRLNSMPQAPAAPGRTTKSVNSVSPGRAAAAAKDLGNVGRKK